MNLFSVVKLKLLKFKFIKCFGNARRWKKNKKKKKKKNNY